MAKTKNLQNIRGNASGGAVYGIGLLGALVYFYQQANGPTEILIGIIKAILWPGFVIYAALGQLGL